MGESYEMFAQVYDMFQDNIDYEAWGTYLIDTLRQNKIDDGLVLDLGCGTGTMTEILAKAGYDMIGVDNSEEMLAEAMDKKAESDLDILYLLQGMEEFELYGTVRAIVSVCDSLNYLIQEEDLQNCFKLVNNYLEPDGLFIFDVSTERKYEMIGDATIAENREDGSFIWENDYDPESHINIYSLTLFLPTETGLYEKAEEMHYQRAYSVEQITSLLTAAGLSVAEIYDAYTREQPKPESERLTFIVKKN